MRRTLILLLLCLLASRNAFAQTLPIPPVIAYQGHIAYSDGSYAIRFSLWDSQTGGNQLWSQTLNAIPVTAGNFSALLTGFTDATFAGSDWLEIQVGNDSPLPRQPVTSTAYAFKADTVPDGSISTGKLANNAVTSGKLATDAAGLAKVSGNVLTSAGGKIGLGTSSPGFPLNFASILGDKIALWGNSGNHYGIGIQSYLLQIHTDAPAANIAFGWGRSDTFTEVMRIQGNGRVGIGTKTPAFPLDVNGLIQMTGFKMPNGAGINRVLTSDSAGVGSWKPLSLTGIAAGGDLTGTYPNPSLRDGSVTASKLAPGVFSSLAWQLGGNSGVTSGFLGTTDNQPLVFKVNNRQAMLYQYAENTSYQARSINVVGGSEVNNIAAGATGATIAGGGATSLNGGSDSPNRVTAAFGTVSGGWANTAGEESFVGGGDGNTASGESSVVGGGDGNFAYGNESSIGGGTYNIASGYGAAILGGVSNTASGLCSTVPGGDLNTAAGQYSLAAGLQAQANYDGCFVWNDASDLTQTGLFASTNINQFLIHASGGVGINMNAPQSALDVRSGNFNAAIACRNTATNSHAVLSAPTVGVIGEDAPTGVSGTGDNDGVYGQSLSSGGNGVRGLNQNSGNFGILGNANYGVYANGPAGGTTAWTQSSDARYKTNVATFPNALEAILHLHGVTFDWKQNEYPAMRFAPGRQIGFIAQELEQVLPELVTTDKNGYKSVAYANVVPVIVEAVKTLNAKVEAQQQQLEAARKENERLKACLQEAANTQAQLAELTARLTVLERSVRK